VIAGCRIFPTIVVFSSIDAKTYQEGKSRIGQLTHNGKCHARCQRSGFQFTRLPDLNDSFARCAPTSTRLANSTGEFGCLRLRIQSRKFCMCAALSSLTGQLSTSLRFLS
jgi:hypothetical protein